MIYSTTILKFLAMAAPLLSFQPANAQQEEPQPSISLPPDLGSIIKRDYTQSEFDLYYERIDTTYKKIGSDEIKTAIFVPKNLVNKKGGPGKNKKEVPLIVHWHGGGLIVGANPEPAWFANWYVFTPPLFLPGVWWW